MNILFDLMSQLLTQLFRFSGDWGLTIILLTICVRLALSPLSIKQKLGMEKQQDVSKKIEAIKEKYKGDEERIQQESKQHYAEAAKGMLGCLTLLLQLPVIAALFSVVKGLPAASTALVPWITSITSADSLYIIPVIYILVSAVPSLLPYVPYLKTTYRAKASKSILLTNIIFSLLIIVKAPVALGMYFITTSLFSIVEEVGFRIYIKTKLAKQV